MALSRKDFLGAVLAGSWEGRLEPAGRGNATLAATALAVAEGAEMLRLHDVEALDAMRVAAAIEGAGAPAT
jgi:dihydropteroate synthase